MTMSPSIVWRCGNECTLLARKLTRRSYQRPSTEWEGIAMNMGRARTAQAVFQSISDDGANWLFVILADDRWAITRNGEHLAVGAGTRASIGAGVEEFRRRTAVVAENSRGSRKLKPQGIIRPCQTKMPPVYSAIEAHTSSKRHDVVPQWFF